MTHYHDADVKKALLDIAPNSKEEIEAYSFGEIKDG
jgi:carbonic anhydrase